MASTDRMYKPMVSTVGTQQVELLCNRLKINAVSVPQNAGGRAGSVCVILRINCGYGPTGKSDSSPSGTKRCDSALHIGIHAAMLQDDRKRAKGLIAASYQFLEQYSIDSSPGKADYYLAHFATHQPALNKLSSGANGIHYLNVRDITGE